MSKKNLTTSRGYTLSLAPVALGSFSIGLSQDMQGNYAIQTSKSWGAGLPSASLSHYTTISNAPNVDKLNGDGYQTGGSVTVGGPSIGAEYTAAFDKNGTVYSGLNISSGIGVSIPVEMHAELTNTSTCLSFNIYDIMKDAYVKIMDW